MLGLHPHCKPAVTLSPQNPLLKDVRKAARQGSLTSRGLALAEGPHLLNEAVRSGAEIEAVLLADGAHFSVPSAVRILHVSDEDFAQITTTEAPQGVLTLIRPRLFTISDLLKPPALVVILDGVQDPGNAGAILRAADAFGASGAIFLKGCVDPYNPKCLRASAGSIFRLPLIRTNDLPDLTLFAADAHSRTSIAAADFTKPCALIIGSEGRGVAPELSARATAVRIPTRHVESLNAAVAAGILLYEARRQRDSA
jgi:TrmH family RNA methyltransferase